MFDDLRHIKLENFDGPYGLLLELIRKEEMNIEDLNLGRITGQYLETITHMQKINFDMAGEYLYFAAMLVHLKSESCLGHEILGNKAELQEGEMAPLTSKEELVVFLKAHEIFKNIGHRLLEMAPRADLKRPKMALKHLVINRPTLSLNDLTEKIIDLIQKEKRKFKKLKREELTIKEKLEHFSPLFKPGESLRFFELLSIKHKGLQDPEGEDKLKNTVITLMMLLELAKLKKIFLTQPTAYEDIYLKVVDTLEGLDLDSLEEGDAESPTTPPAKNEQHSPMEMTQ